MNSWQVKFNYEIIYYRHLTYHIDSVKPKMVIFFASEFLQSFRNMIF